MSLQIGHRQSIDLDLFTIEPYDVPLLQEYLTNKYNFYTDRTGINTLIGHIGDVKTDFVTHSASLVNPLLTKDNLRMASLHDIAAMKLNAISQSGKRLKDFIDVFCLLEIMPFRKMLEAYEIKYPNSNPIIPIRAVTYFGDIDFNMDKPVMIKKVPIKKMKERLIKAVQKPNTIF